MEESEKYLIHAHVTADGVVERSDVVGAIFGQTEGLLGAEMDLRHLQERSKVGRIDVDVDSEGGRSFGEVTIATSLDRVETAVLAAALETIDRVGPCRAELRVSAIEDVRAAKRREVVERAKELLADAFDESAASTGEILREVRRAVRVEDVTEFEGLPAGPNVGDSDAVIVVEGRADVLQLLQYGVKNAVAVEGTDVPDAIAELSAERTVTAFLDGDRGGDLILRELGQVGDVDYVALAPPDRAVEDLSRREVVDALREKVPFEMVDEEGPGRAVPTDGGTVPGQSGGSASSPEWPGPDDASGAASPPGTGTAGQSARESDDSPSAAEAGVDDKDRQPAGAEPTTEGGASEESGRTGGEEATAGGHAGRATGVDGTDGADGPAESGAADGAAGAGAADAANEAVGVAEDAEDADADAGANDAAEDGAGGPTAPLTLREHVEAVVGEGTGTVRLLDADGAVLSEAAAEDAFDAVEGVAEPPTTVVLDGTATQRLLDVTAQRGAGRLVARAVGDVVKEPAGVRVLTADQLLA